MADLMTGKSTYKQLADDYANFVVPAVKVKVNGIDVVKNMQLVVQELTAKLSLDVASSVTIKFAFQYSEKNHSFSSNVKNTFKLGTVVSVELGYLSNTKTIFKGYVDMAGVEMGEYEVFVVTLMDVKRLMMISGRRAVLYNVKNYSDAFKQVMGNYSMVCSTQIDSTNDQLEKPISQTGTDFDFVEKELIASGKVNREFMVFAGTAYFRKPHKVTVPSITLRYGRELVDFAVSHCYRDLKFEIVGVDETQKMVTGSASAKSSISQMKLIPVTPVSTIVDPYANTRDKAKERAEVMALKYMEKSAIGHGKTIGLPEIVPGRYVEIENIDAMMDKKYYITEVTHIYSSEKFETQFEVGGSA